MSVQTLPEHLAEIVDEVDRGVRKSATEYRDLPRSDIDTVVRILLVRLADLPAEHPDRARIRARAVELYLPVATQLVRRFRNRSGSVDDLKQVAAIGLMKAIDGYDTSRANEFSSYAIPTIVGELKRHFRDRGWSMRVPRRMQELSLEISKATEEVAQRLQRSPTVADLAAHLEVSDEDIIAGLDSTNAYNTLSLQAPVAGEDSELEAIDLVSTYDEDLDAVDDRETLRPLLRRLSLREQQIVIMRFFGNMTQSQIAGEIGVSQMHVSRLLSRSLAQMREWLVAEK